MKGWIAIYIKNKRLKEHLVIPKLYITLFASHIYDGLVLVWIVGRGRV